MGLLSPTKKPHVLWAPLPKQERFLSCPAFEVGYGGAPGGGKSDAMLIAPLMGLGHQGYKALLLRRKYIDLERSLIVRSHELYRGRGQWDGQNKRWKFPANGSIEFGHCQNETDIYNYQSAQYQFVGIEQAEQFTESMYTYFWSRIRTTNPDIKPKFRCNFNPGGIGHTFLKRRFWIHERTANQAYPIKETLKRPDGSMEEFEYWRAYIPATVYDNDHIMKNDRQYLMRLMALPEPQRTAYLEGRFDLFEGQFFKEWDERIHVCAPFEIPHTWRRSMAFDWGYSAPAAVLWFAEDPKDHTVYVYKELYITQKIDIELAKEFDEMSEREQIYAIYYPWDLDNIKPEFGVSMRERMDDVTGRKYYWKIGNKKRIQGWAAVRHLLAKRPDGTQRMKVFNTCRNLIRTFPEQIFDEGNSEDLDTTGEDHAVDALRYFAATFRSYEEMMNEMSRATQPQDLGPGIRYPDGQYAFKKERPMVFNWLAD